ncbi:Phthiocerol/phthiodiolone dimycocerosyl transferase [Legionella steigerwaltii]|uniref:Phthiocerol/phthiodiolone dimycocerosyl transferase n=1 Tax=Legionella steigerwaltii TaxID=460 RepID=A0A378L6L5_9GAMM|nr:SRPBCC family protein [Legionella steigerwaltii]KTD77014.1 Phthiocerol/phthiodiolone dimycocerosyl transferase [Legionella steigerwaltii]STY22443.1 Phthiocerol/phthiodiolone dimycocerosyl transferase [Legionella steigerwaltii]
MTKASVKKDINASADKVWQIIGDFEQVHHWVEDVAAIEIVGSGIGCLRKLHVDDHTMVEEQLLKLDDRNRIISYGSVNTELPFEDYIATIEVHKLDITHCYVTWVSTFTPVGMTDEEAVKLLEENYSRYLARAEQLAQQNILRWLSNSETLFVNFDMPLLAFCQLQGKMTREIIHHAFKALLVQYPVLDCLILGRKDNYFFVKRTNSNHIPIQLIEHVASRAKRQTIIEEVLNSPLNREEALFEVILLLPDTVQNITEKTEFELIIKFHHAIVDVHACVLLLKNLFTSCNLLIQDSTINSPKNPKIEVTPPIESYIPPDIKRLNKQDLLKALQQTESAYNPKTLPIQSPNVPQSTLKCDVFVLELSKEQTELIINHCKQNGATVQGALCAGHLLTIRKTINDSKEQFMIACRSVIDLRSLVNPPIDPQSVSATTTGFIGYYKVSPDDSFWDLAKEVVASIQENIQTNTVFKNLLIHKETIEKMDRPVAITVSNAGRIDLPQSFGNLKLINVNFNTSIFMPAPHLVVTTMENKMSLNYLYTKPWLSTEQIRTLAKQSLDCILSV